MVRIFLDFVRAWCSSMLAPPGYAKIASTPSRSSAATRISLPSMGGPSSARTEAAGLFLLAVNVVLLIVLPDCDRQSRANKKPTTVASRGFLSKFRLASTSPAGGADNYNDDLQQYLSNVSNHGFKDC